jgi:cystathionine beta-lyase
MAYNFDNIIDRWGSGSVKYDLAEPGVIPLWVADMDFASPPEVGDALLSRVKHGVFGYGTESKEFFQSFIDWQREKNGWTIDPSWVLFSPGVVTSLYMAVKAFTEKGDAVIVQPPVYRPFFMAVENSGRRLVSNPLIAGDNGYRMDFDDLDRKIGESGARLLLLCSPHNPVGRVWREEELSALGDICKKRNVVVVSDEIHSDLVFHGFRHIPLPMSSSGLEGLSCVFSAPSKTFNIPGIKVSFAVIPDRALRERFKSACVCSAVGEPSIFGPVASIAAYRKGAPWLSELLSYLEGSRKTASAFLSAELPQVRFSEPEGTYLMWLDFRALGFSEAELDRLLLEKGRVWLQKGSFFGKEGEGFFRLNLASPRAVLEEGLRRIKKALS